jgi:N-acyl amino acid synthase FeeM
MIRLHSSRTNQSMPDTPQSPIGIKNRSRDPDEWDRTIIAFESPYKLKDLCIPQYDDSSAPTETVQQQKFKIRLASSDTRRRSASMLIEKRYASRGYQTRALEEDPQRITVLVFMEEKIVGTTTLGLDGPSGLMADSIYKDEIDALRAEGHSVCELTKLAIDDENVDSKHIVAVLFHLCKIYGQNIHHATDFIIEINPRHASFYKKLLGFKDFGSEKLCPRVNAPAVLLRLSLDYVDEQIARFGGLQKTATGVRTLYPFCFSKEDELGIASRLIRGE